MFSIASCKNTLISYFASGFSKASFYPVGQATAAIEKSLQICKKWKC